MFSVHYNIYCGFILACSKSLLLECIIITLSIGTDRPEQTVKTQIRCRILQCLIRVYTVCPSSSVLLTHQEVPNYTIPSWNRGGNDMYFYSIFLPYSVWRFTISKYRWSYILFLVTDQKKLTYILYFKRKMGGNI